LGTFRQTHGPGERACGIPVPARPGLPGNHGDSMSRIIQCLVDNARSHWRTTGQPEHHPAAPQHPDRINPPDDPAGLIPASRFRARWPASIRPSPIPRPPTALHRRWPLNEVSPSWTASRHSRGIGQRARNRRPEVRQSAPGRSACRHHRSPTRHL